MRTTVILAAAACAASAAAAAADPPPPMPTRDFVQAAAGSDRFEILEARVALIEGRDRRVRTFAQEMIQAHASTSEALRQATAAAGLPPPPPGLSGDQAALLGALQGQRGGDFDKTYARHQVLGHQQALVVAQGYAEQGDTPAVRQAAASAVPIISHHLDEAHRLCTALRCDG